MFESIINAIKAAFRYIVNLVRKVINGILNFAKEVVDWFKSLSLNPQKIRRLLQTLRSLRICSRLHLRKKLVSLKEYIMRKKMRLQLIDTLMQMNLTKKLKTC